ncbi:MAG: aminotransferase class I/II-fold pyridoxal phosphate-dependent enzyme [Deltaproteobacteria bacterium]|nr:aminotransferase class I/II-fold pyridoxal phosphate-dependent enzyme [Deltaproteobacteria bacterium]
MPHAAVTANRRLPRTGHLKLSPIKAIELAASRVPGAVSLAQGIPSFDTPEPIKIFVQQKIAEGACAKYSLSPGLPELRELIAESLLREGMHYDADNEIIVTCGSIEGIASTLLTLTQPGDEVILPSPSYASYQEVVRMAGCTPRFAPLREEQNFAFDLDAFERCISPRTSAILYCNPNNPTGTVFSKEETVALVELAECHDLFLIIDEAYKDFVFTKEPYFSPAQIHEQRGRVVRVFTFSKAYGMTGWRVGYVHSDAGNVREILKVHDALVTCAPVVSQYGAIAALEYGAASIAAFRQAFKERRDRTLQHLEAFAHVFDYQKPEGAYFIFPRVKDSVPRARDSRRLALHILEQAKVALVPGVAFGPSGEAHLRLNFGRDVADIDTAFERLRSYFQQQLPFAGARREPLVMPVQVDATPYPAEPAAKGRWHQSVTRAATWYLQGAARFFLRRKKPQVIAIAGNRGKTVVKRLFGELLSRHYRVRTNPRSYNTEIGLPLAVLNIELETQSLRKTVWGLLRAGWTALVSSEQPEVLVVELGIRRRGDMRQLLRTLQPDVTVLTALAPGYQDDIEGIRIQQEEMRTLCQSTGAGCHFLIEDSDPLLQEAVHGLAAPFIPLGSAQWLENGHGLLLRSQKQEYAVTRELIGESERVAVQAAVLFAEQWTSLTADDIRRFLAGENTDTSMNEV